MTKLKSKSTTDLKDKLGQPYTLICHNDDYNTFAWVIECLMKVCGHEYLQAEQCAHIIHFTGKCDVKRGDYETLNEMYMKLSGANLTVTLEEN